MSKGGGGSSSPPPAVDPIALGNAQLNANLSTGAQQAGLNNVNTFSPFGSSQFSAYGTGPGGIGPAGYNLNTSLNPNIQGVFDAQTSLAQLLARNAGSLGNLATGGASSGADLVNRAYGALGGQIPTGPVDTSQLPSLSSGIHTGSDFALPGSFNSGGQIQSGLDFSNLPALQSQLNFSGLSPLSPGQGIQGNLDFSGLSRLSPGQGIQGNLDFNGLPNLPTSTTDFSQEVGQAQNAAYKAQSQYLDPQFAQKHSDLTQQLADQGISAGTDAYSRAVGDLGRQENLAYSGARDAAVAAGNQEQAQLYGENLSSRQQGVGERQTQGQFANAAQQLGYGEDLSARQQGVGEQQAQGQFSNSAQQQRYGQDLSSRQQGASELQAGGAFANAARQQAAAEAQAQGGFSNAAQQLGFGENQAGAQFKSAAQGQDFGQELQRAQLAAQNRQQGFNEAVTKWGQPLSALGTAAGIGEGSIGNGVSTLSGLSPFMNFSGTGTVPTTIGNTSIYPANIVGAANSGIQAAQNRFNAGNTLNNQLFNGIGSLGGALGFGGNGGLGNALGITGQGGSIFGAGGLFGPAAGSAVDFGAGGSGSFFTGLGAADAGSLGIDPVAASLLGFL